MKSLDYTQENLLAEVENLLTFKFELKNTVQLLGKSQTIRATLTDYRDKTKILAEKSETLKITNIYTNADLTNRDNDLQYKLKQLAKSERDKEKQLNQLIENFGWITNGKS